MYCSLLFLHAKMAVLYAINFVLISNSIYRQVNISESGSISRFIDSAILGVWPIALRLFIVHVIISIVVFALFLRWATQGPLGPLVSQKVTGQPVNDFLSYLLMHMKQNSQDWALGASLLQVLNCTKWLSRLVMGHKIAFPYVIILPKTELMRLVKTLQWLLLVC